MMEMMEDLDEEEDDMMEDLNGGNEEDMMNDLPEGEDLDDMEDQVLPSL